MSRKRLEPTYDTRKIRVGELVRFRWGLSDRDGVVIEDRGPLGGNGKQVVRIRYFMDYAGDGTLEPVETEKLAEDVKVVGDTPTVGSVAPVTAG